MARRIGSIQTEVAMRITGFLNVNRGYYNNYIGKGSANNRFQQRPGYQRYNSYRN